MVFDYKKEFKALYAPKAQPSLVTVPKMNFIAVRGQGNPNDPEGAYQKSLPLLYAVAYTLKMSKKTDYRIAGYFDYVVPPLEGFWWQEGLAGVDYHRKDDFSWIALIRLPDFVTVADVDWAKAEASRKKKLDLSAVEFFTYDEGLCVQCLHIGSYDDEPETVQKMTEFLAEHGYCLDITDQRYHHEIYLSDPRKVAVEKRKTILRHPIRKITD